MFINVFFRKSFAQVFIIGLLYGCHNKIFHHFFELHFCCIDSWIFPQFSNSKGHHSVCAVAYRSVASKWISRVPIQFGRIEDWLIEKMNFQGKLIWFKKNWSIQWETSWNLPFITKFGQFSSFFWYSLLSSKNQVISWSFSRSCWSVLIRFWGDKNE